MEAQIRCPNCGKYSPDWVEFKRVYVEPTGKTQSRTWIVWALVGGLVSLFYFLISGFSDGYSGPPPIIGVVIILWGMGVCIWVWFHVGKFPRRLECHCKNCGKLWSIGAR